MKIQEKNFTKSLYIGYLIVTVLILALTFLEYESKKKNIEDELSSLHDSIYFEYQKRLQESVNQSINFIESSYTIFLTLQNNGDEELSPLYYKKFENHVRKYLYMNVFDKSRYTWINKIINFDGGENYAIRLIHPNLKKTEGKLLSTSMQDSKGNFPFLDELIGVRTNKEVFFTYYFKQLHTGAITEKVSYSKLYERLNWVVATGIPLHILEAKIKGEELDLIQRHEDEFLIAFLIKMIIFIVITMMVVFFRKNSVKYIHNSLKEQIEELNVINSKLNLATQTANIGVWEWDIVNNALEWDDMMYNIYELDKKNSTNRFELWRSSLVAEYKDDAESKILQAVENHIKFESKFKINTPSGIKTIEAYGKCNYDSNNQPINMIGINIDISSKEALKDDLVDHKKELEIVNLQLAQKVDKMTEENFRQTQVIQEQNRLATLGEMIGAIAHNWRQPLNELSIRIQKLKFYYKQKSSMLDEEFINKFVEDNIKTIEFMSDTINDFRNFSKQDKMVKEFNVKESITKVLSMFEAQLSAHNVKVNLIGDGFIVVGPQSEFEQTILNLISNADYQLTTNSISPAFIDITMEENILTIEDNGGGIDTEIIKRVFDPYFTTKDQGEGTGIGLYMTRMIINSSFNAEINVSNGKDGARFTIIFK